MTTYVHIGRILCTAIKLVKDHFQVIFPCNEKLVDKFTEDFLPESMDVCCASFFLLVLFKSFPVIAYYFHFLQKFSVSNWHLLQ